MPLSVYDPLTYPHGFDFAREGACRTMIFNSLPFAAFFLIVGPLYWFLGRWGYKAQNLLLLGASYFFYGWVDWRLCGLLLVSTGVDFTVGQRLAKDGEPSTRKRLVLVSIVVNLGILGFFKYFGFFTDSFAEALNRAGVDFLAPSLNIILPVGISFYTFQSMSYTIDVYRRRLEPITNLRDFALYVAYFPQLVAGPIERATRLMPQIQKDRAFPTAEKWSSGLGLIALGLFKKVVIADTAAGVVQDVYGRSGTAGVLELLVATYVFALQIYGDFSGYSDIARGVSRLLGIELMENFRQPYLATSVTDFWRRWHISLSEWLRDYLYIPLGGNRRGPRRTMINLGLTMLLGGLWHGAAWTFVVWGGLHGLYLAAERAVRPRDWAPRGRLAHGLWTLATFHLVCLAWVFFRADTFGQAADVLVGIASLRGLSSGLLDAVPVKDVLNVLGPGLLALGLVDHLQRRTGDELGIVRLPHMAQGAVYGGFVALIILFSGGAPVPFLYFQF